ncbi:CoA transferase, partial [Clostridioides difficile]|nr:CoA transferase [Clostridioides difficile]
MTSCSLAGGICAALYRQQKTGLGGKVEVSLFGQAIWNVGALIASTQYEDVYPKSRKEAISPVINSYQCKDGKWIFLSILEHERYFGTLCTEVLGRGDLAEDERFAGMLEAKRHAAELIQILDGEFARYTQDEIVDRLTKADIAHERIQHVKDVLKDEQALANQYLICR